MADEVVFSPTGPNAFPAATNTQQAPASMPEVRVRVRLVDGVHEITSTHRVPAKSLVLNELTAAQRRLITPQRYRTNRYYDLDNCMRAAGDAISCTVWADAIAAATIKALANTSDAEAVLRTPADGGYLAIGDGVYKISFHSATPLNKAAAVIRKRATDLAKAQAEVIVANGRSAASAIIRDANEIRAKAQAELQAAQRQHSLLPPPQLAEGGYPLRLRGTQWQVGIDMDLRLRSFNVELGVRHPRTGDEHRIRKEWRTDLTVLAQNPAVKVRMWVPLGSEGQYAATSIMLDGCCPLLPHMNHSASCMGLAEAPERIVSTLDAQRLKESLIRVHQGVNLSSLYVGAQHWANNAFKPFIPPQLAQIIGRGDGAWLDHLYDLMQREWLAQIAPPENEQPVPIAQNSLVDDAPTAADANGEVWNA